MFKFKPRIASSTLDLEVVKSEYQRSFLITILFVAGLAVTLVNFLLLDPLVADFYGGYSIYMTTAMWILLIIIYEFIVLQMLRKKIKNRQRVGTGFKLWHTLIEISFPSLIMYFMVFRLGMLSFLDSPINSLYFIFIILSILHLDFTVSVFTGILAAVQYSVIIHYGFLEVTPIDTYAPASPENSYYLRTISLILGSAAAGFVAHELKSRIRISFESKKAKDEIELLFDQQVSREVSKALIKDKGVTKRLEATVMFLDIRDFTTFADSHTPDEVIDFQNKFLSPVIDIINLHQGVVFQILGDGVMACFGSPVENVLHADMAFQASLQIRAKVKELSESAVIPATRIGIGLHSGQIVTGNIGNEQRKQFSISGSPVIVASRLEQLNKKFGTELLISHDVLRNINTGKVQISFVTEETLRGIGLPVKVYKVV
ncbi:MAG: adenylate/guanylate cyclase domain-containing protein [Cytophagia bacterium]|nr:adenylate/guanylate cyclase domain-containing protein [Cytophagia bacterium]NBW36601.1 adenylate/guanylate cyclase domain-containing protein [Cytophagia bacterium]